MLNECNQRSMFAAEEHFFRTSCLIFRFVAHIHLCIFRSLCVYIMCVHTDLCVCLYEYIYVSVCVCVGLIDLGCLTGFKISIFDKMCRNI